MSDEQQAGVAEPTDAPNSGSLQGKIDYLLLHIYCCMCLLLEIVSTNPEMVAVLDDSPGQTSKCSKNLGDANRIRRGHVFICRPCGHIDFCQPIYR